MNLAAMGKRAHRMFPALLSTASVNQHLHSTSLDGKTLTLRK